jgi:hypothetical protein
MSRSPLRTRGQLVAVAAAALTLWSCKENLPTGPDSFSVALSVTGWSDTIVVGDTRSATVVAKDGAGRAISGLSYTWTVNDPTVAALVANDTSSGRTRGLTALKPGPATATIALTDPRFVVPNLTKTVLSVAAGMAVLSSKDTTMTAINDTIRLIGTGYVRTNGVATAKAGLGLRWSRQGSGATTLIASTGDTVRVIAKSGGVDTLIANADFCLRGARCADTVYARVQQTLRLTLSAKSFNAWSFNDTVGPTITLADRRGNGVQLSRVSLIPVLAADSAAVRATAAQIFANGTTGVVTGLGLIAQGNGAAKIAVVGRYPDGTIADRDTITATVRQVARRITIAPRSAQITSGDSVPARLGAADARANVIADATVTATTLNGLTLSGTYLKGTTTSGTLNGTAFAAVTGVAALANNPTAPALPAVVVDTSNVQIVPAISIAAGAGGSAQAISLVLRSPTGGALANAWVRFKATAGTVSADSVQTDAAGNVSVSWTPPTAAGVHVLTGTLASAGAPITATDSAGFVVLRRKVTITAGAASPTASSVAIRTATFVAGDTATVTLTVKDAFGNFATATTFADVVITPTGGTIGGVNCLSGVCTTIFTATTAGAGSIAASVGGTAVTGSPLALTVTHGTATQLLIVTQPVAAGAHNVALATMPIVRVADQFGNTATSVSTGVCTATATILTGTPTMVAQVATIGAGICNFGASGLTFGGGGGTINLVFTATVGGSSLTPATSSTITNPP